MKALKELTEFVGIPMWIFSNWLSDQRWYRRLRGGTWYSVTPYFAWYISVWTREQPLSFERINAVEEW